MVNGNRRLFLRQIGWTAFAAGCDGVFPGIAFAAAAPEARGVPSAAVNAFLDAAAAGAFELHSLVVMRAGMPAVRAWWAPYRAQAPHSLYSLSKSFTSTAVGFAVAAGKLKLTDKVVDFFPEQKPAQVSENLAALNVEHLLTMSVGQAGDAAPVITHEQDWVKTFLALPIQSPPGSVFLYNSAATYMLSAIVQKLTGERIVDYLRTRLFDPLGLPPMRWSECPRGINTGGWGLSATTDAISKFGQFYLQKGRWNGKQLLPREWIEQATSFKIQPPPGPGQDLAQLKKDSDWHQGYAYQFWRCRHDAFRGDGAFGQFCIVIPALDAVVAITSRTLDMQGVINLVWEHLLPGLREAAQPVDRTASDHLRTRLAGLALALPEGSAASPQAVAHRDFAIESNALGVRGLTIAFDSGRCRLGFDTGGKLHTIDCGIGRWRDGETELPGTPPEWTEVVGTYVNPRHPAKIAAAGAWKDANTFQMRWRYYETPHLDEVTLHFSDDGVEVSFLNSLTQMAAAVHPETRPVLKGKARS